MKKFLLLGAILFLFYLTILPKKDRRPGSQNPPSFTESISQAATIGKPVRLIINRIGVNAKIEHVGLDRERNMDVPKSWDNAGWYSLGPKPGMPGNVVIDGHLDSPNGPAVFFRLSKLEKGDEIYIISEDGKEYIYTVNNMEKYEFDKFPLKKVFGETNSFNLNLITCVGVFDRIAKNYSHRIVVYSSLLQ